MLQLTFRIQTNAVAVSGTGGNSATATDTPKIYSPMAYTSYDGTCRLALIE